MSAPRALFVSSTRIGDCVLSSGVVEAIRERLPGVAITVACGPLAAELFRAAPSVRHVHVMAKRPNGGHWLDLWTLAARTRWDLVVDIRGSAVAWLVRAGERRVYARRRDGGAHKVVEAARLMGLDQPIDPRVWLDERARADAAAVIGDDPAPILAVAPVAAIPSKTWPAPRWAELVERALASPRFSGWRVMAVGGPGDRAAAAPVLAAAGAAGIDAVGRLDILASAAALSRAALFVGNDSGTMHLAAAAGTPTLGLFGATDWRRYGPWGGHAGVVTADPGGRPGPMTDLSVDRALAALLAAG